MLSSRAFFVACIAVFAFAIPPVWSHPGAINLYVDNATTPGRLAPLPTYEPGWFALYPGIELSSETPGISVGFPANGVAPQTQLELEITQHLLYWDGQDVVPTNQTMRVVRPEFDNEGNFIASAVDEYVVSATSRVLQGMTWGTYSGNDFWEADGLFFMDDLDAPHGIYALGYRVYSSNYLASQPFLVSFVYDPLVQWTPAERLAGIAQLRAAFNPRSGDFNSDGSFDCIDVDGLVAEIVAGNHPSSFDLTLDGLVDSADLQHWLADAGSARNATHQPFLGGDGNLDGVVDGSDFGIWNASKFTQQAAWCRGDFNADGSVDGSDFGIWNANKFTSSDAITVPEPAQAWLSLVSAVLMVCPRRRR